MTNTDLADIVDSIRFDRIRITDHAYEETRQDKLSFDEVFYSVLNGEIIERYPDDFPYPCCLVYGNTFVGDPVHSVWAYSAKTQDAVLVTVYRPDPARWIDWRSRKNGE